MMSRLAVIVAAGWAIASAHAEPVLIRLDHDGSVRVESVTTSSLTLDANSAGFIIWSDGKRESWRHIPAGGSWSQSPGSATGPAVASLFSTSRGAGGDAAQPNVPLTAQLDQILGQTIVRGRGFLTPHNGFVLDGRITIRRQPANDTATATLPAAVAVLSRGNTELARVPFKQGVSQVAFREIDSLARRFPGGLPPGEYTLRIDGGAASSTFTVEDTEWRDEVLAFPDELAALLDEHTALPGGGTTLRSGRTDPLYLQVAVEHLLDQLDEDARPLSYLTDALDLLESVPADRLTSHLRDLRENLLRRLAGKEPRAAVESTGIAAIDRARGLITRGQWKAAAKTLDDVPTDRRSTALAEIYRAVIQSESGPAAAEAADVTFQNAIQSERLVQPADLFLAHNNYANFLLNRSQDLLYNHAFQMAAGVQEPLLRSLTFWRRSERQYQAAFRQTAELDSNQRAAVLINFGRLHVLLGDLIRTLDPPVDGRRTFSAGDEAADRVAREYAALIVDDYADKVEPVIVAAAEELLAQLDYRLRKPSCLEHAWRARAAYLQAGSLAGVESVYRLTGLYLGRSAASQDESLTHLLISSQLAELLRDRIPADQIGVSQAGFFARRAYVHEKIVEALFTQGRAADALHHAELAKARSLQDLLALQHVGDDSARSRGPSELPSELPGELPDKLLAELLDDWPPGVAALEYFVGTTRTWLFVVDGTGTVRMHELPLDGGSRELVASVVRLQDEMGFQAVKMRRRLLGRQGFDHRWQDTLHDFFNTLIPPGVLDQLRQARSVVIVPHHVLHYFPFAALVTARDEQERGPYEMVQPRFVLDEPFDLVYAPSLLSWDALRRRTNRPIRDVRGVGIVEFEGYPRLPGVDRDFDNMKAAFGSRVSHVLYGDAASETRTRASLSSPGMVLFATHGINVADDPLESHLITLNDAANDGRLTAAELFASRVEADMVVLSACYSGLADRSPLPGDDLFGLQRSLLKSGARTVVSGLWDVYDGSGPEVMQAFFERLAAGDSAAAALAVSQRAFLKQHRAAGNDPWVHPYFWSVYTVAGDERTRFEK